MKVPKSDFKVFQEEFKKWQDRFGCNHWYTYFEFKPLEDAQASLRKNEESAVCCATLSSELKHDTSDPKGNALHESLHLLLAKLTWMAKCRFIHEEEIDAEDERVVRILERWIKQ